MMTEVDVIVYYTIQHRRTAETAWQDPDGKLVPVDKEDDWCGSSHDFFRFNPWIGSGNKARKRNKSMSDDKYNLWCATGCNGWTKLKYALKALKEVRKGDTEGLYDSAHQGRKQQGIRHAFRIVQCRYFSDCRPIDLNDPAVAAELG